MSNENGTMDNEVAATGIDDGVSQSEMQDSFMEQFEVVNDDGTPIEQPAEEKTPEAPVQQQAQPVKQPEAPATPAAPVVTDYAAEFRNQDGSLNVEKAVEFFGAKKEAAPPAPVPQPVQQPVAPAAPQPAPTAPADPYQEMKRTYTAAIELQRHFMSADGGSNDPQTAMVLAEQAIESHLKEQFFNSEIKKLREEVNNKLAAKDKEISEARELAIAEPIAEKNLINTINKYAKGMSAETLRKAIFDRNLGGTFLERQFHLSNPDAEKLTGDEWNKAINNWFVMVGSKHPSFIEDMAINALNRIRELVQPEFVKQIQQNALERKGVQNATKPGPRTAQNPAGTNPGGQASIIDQFFHNVPRETPVGRPHI
jgi:hypothetical protein